MSFNPYLPTAERFRNCRNLQIQLQTEISLDMLLQLIYVTEAGPSFKKLSTRNTMTGYFHEYGLQHKMERDLARTALTNLTIAAEPGDTKSLKQHFPIELRGFFGNINKVVSNLVKYLKANPPTKKKPMEVHIIPITRILFAVQHIPGEEGYTLRNDETLERLRQAAQLFLANPKVTF